VHTTFDGRALAVVRATGPGDIKLAISSADGLSATVALATRGGDEKQGQGLQGLLAQRGRGGA